jgi:MFS superfamily sulfate permease-like transporter
LVSIPEIGSLSGLSDYLIHPKLASFAKFKVIKVGIVIAIIASLETLLCVEATDRLDPRKNITPTNRELKAQGFGNIISGLLGGIPVTQVIVRSSANIQAGGRTKLAAIMHGVFLFGTVMLIPNILNMIPLSALAAILLVIGFKLAKPAMFKRLYHEGQDQFIPFVTTIVAVLFTDLLVGILIGLLVGIGYVLFTNFRSAIVLEQKGRHMIIHFKKDVFFYNRAELMKLFSQLESGDELTLDGTKVDFIDHDIFLAIQDFVNLSKEKEIKVNVLEITRQKITFVRQKNQHQEIEH